MRRSRERALDGRFTVSRNRGGRPKGPNPLVRHRSRKPFADTQPCHVTLKVRAGLPSLRQGQVVRELESVFRRGNERRRFRLVHYSIQADHAHLIVEASDRDALGRGMPPPPLGNAPAVAEPRTWFLRVGWRRHGLLSPNEIPGALQP
jgi:hypothetical protein